MTSRERLTAAFRLEPTDRIPIHVRGVPAWDEDWLRAKGPSFEPLFEAVRQYCDWCAGWGAPRGIFFSATDQISRRMERKPSNRPDYVIHETIIETPQGPIFEQRHVSTKGLPSLETKYYLETDEDLERFLSIPYVPPEPDVAPFFAFRDRIGDRGIVLVSAGMDPLGEVYCLLGTENLALWSVNRRSDIFMLLDLMYERQAALFRYLLEQGVGPFFAWVGPELATPPLQSPQDFYEFVVEYDKKLIEIIHSYGGLVHVHCHGFLDDVLEGFAEMGANCLHPIEAPPWGDVSLAEAKRRIGDRVCLEGNIQLGDLFDRSTAEVEQIVREAIAEGKPGGGFILCPTASPYIPELPERVRDNYLVMIRLGLELGRY